jgi:3-hydroxybutyryl-CoA dehydrogenase
METISIIGAGTMGSGITQVFLEHGYRVIMNDISESTINSGKSSIIRNLDRSIEKGRITAETKEKIIGNLVTSTEIESLSQSSLIIEAVSENIGLKKDIFRKLDKICRNDVILASNTSSLSITEISNATGRPANVIGMHFFNPAPVIRLVEIIRGLKTSDETYDKVHNYALSADKTPVKVLESPGFIVNRLLIPMINEAVGVYAEGIAGAGEIDEAMKLGANHPIGPLALADLIGLDVVLAIMDNLQAETGDGKYRPHPLLKKMVRGGMLGKKTKSGFFSY